MYTEKVDGLGQGKLKRKLKYVHRFRTVKCI